MNSEKKALLIVAHGSRRQLSNDAVAEMSEQVAELAGERFITVSCAFLELAEPSIESGIDQCVAAGADEVVVMPYFLSPGRHVAEDVPGIVQAKQKEYPELNIHLGTYLGAAPAMAGMILETVDRGYCLCGKEQSECVAPACLQS